MQSLMSQLFAVLHSAETTQSLSLIAPGAQPTTMSATVAYNIRMVLPPRTYLYIDQPSRNPETPYAWRFESIETLTSQT